MKLRPLHGAYICNAIVTLIIFNLSNIWLAGLSILLLSGTVTLCQMEWEKLGPNKNAS